LAESAQAIVNNVSSAKSLGVKFDVCGRSFTYKANNRGPSDGKEVGQGGYKRNEGNGRL